MTAPLLTMEGISKRFGATQALDGVSLTVDRGQVHALIGENGAGKSTLMKILAGVHSADRGQMKVEGKLFAPNRPVDALHAGVAMIHQELNLAPDMSVEANILLGQERATWGWVRGSEHRELAKRALAMLSHPNLPLDTPIGQLPIAMQQLVEIARALVSNAKVVVFDEPTSSLTEEDAEHLFEVIHQLQQQGMGIVYISHFLEEVARVSDVYTVLRDGKAVDSGQLSEVSLDHIVHQMVGRELDELFPQVPHTLGQPVLQVKALSGDPIPSGIDLTVRRGEIFGLAGLVGAGRSELLRSIFGLERVAQGRVVVHGNQEAGHSAHGSIANGLGLVSEDRKSEGLSLPMSIADNLTLSNLGPYLQLGLLSLGRRDVEVNKWMQKMSCKADRPSQPIQELSGGNQQKIAIARLLHQGAEILLLDEPTRGIDVATKAEIYRLVGELAASGKAILMVSSYLPELLNVCDTIGVMCRGILREIRSASAWTAEDIMHVATGREATV